MGSFIFYSLLFTSFLLSGCVIRTVPYEVDRVDQEIEGNRGIVRGKVPPVSGTGTVKTRKMYDLEIELPMASAVKKPEQKIDSYEGGNRGYLKGQSPPEDKKGIGRKRRDLIRLGAAPVSGVPQVVYKGTAMTSGKYKKEKGSGILAKKEPRIYVVEKGDTLQKISNKMYGTTRKWKRIYEANKGVVEGPNKIKPGQKLVIPEL